MRENAYNPGHNPFEDPEQAEASRRRAQLMGLLRGRWHWAVLLAVVLAVAGGYLGYNSQPDKYVARSSVDVMPRMSAPTDIIDPTQSSTYISYVDQQMSLLKSTEVIEKAMGTREWMDNLARRPGNLEEPTLSSFASSIQLREPDHNKTTIPVGFSDRDAGTARAGLNSLLTAYEQVYKQISGRHINEDINQLNGQLRDQENEEKRILTQMDLVVPASRIGTIRAELTFKLSDRAGLERQLSAIDLRLKPYLDAPAEATEQQLREMMLQDPEMQALIAQKEADEQQISYLTDVLGRGQEHRDVLRLKRSIQTLERRIAEFEADWLGGTRQVSLPVEVQELKAQREGLVRMIAELDAAIEDLSTKASAIGQYEIALEDIRGRIRETKNKIDEYNRTDKLFNQNSVSRVVIGPLQPTPSEPDNTDKRRQLAGVGAIGGFFVGFGLVMAVGLFDRRLRHVSDTELGLPDANVLGILPTLPAKLEDPEDAEAAAHCVHHIRTLLQIGGGNRVFSITSPSAGSGKSSLCTALGMSFANAGTNTLVIDCDLVGAGLSRRMGTVVHEPLESVIRKRGLLDEALLAGAVTASTSLGKPLDEVLLAKGLMDEHQIEVASRLQRDTAMGVLDACAPGKLRSCVATTGMPNLFIIPVGHAKPADATKLSPAAVRELIRQAREEFDMVLIDTGPVLGSLEASIAAAEADATVLIVSRGDQKALASRTLAQLRSVHANIAGIVFNHALESDLAHTSYASVVSQERRPDRSVRRKRIDQTRSARLGPLGSAVASYSSEGQNGENGNASGNGRDGD